MPRTRLLFLLTAVLLSLAACSGGGDAGGGGGAPEAESGGGGAGYGAPDSAEEPAGGAAAGTGAVVMSGNAFDPAELQVTAGEATSITVENTDGVLHSFTFEDAGVDQDVEGGQTVTVEVTVPDAGTYRFFCKYHSGMEGSVTVA